jgi:hypothetical protein
MRHIEVESGLIRVVGFSSRKRVNFHVRQARCMKGVGQWGGGCGSARRCHMFRRGVALSVVAFAIMCVSRV